MRYHLTTLAFLLIPAAIGGYAGVVFLGRSFSGYFSFIHGANIGGVIGAIAGFSLGCVLASSGYRNSNDGGIYSRFQFTLRELLLLLTVGCLISGWIVDHRLLIASNNHWNNYLTAVCHRLEQHGELVFTRDKDNFQVRSVISETADGYPFFSASKNRLMPVPVPLPPNKGDILLFRARSRASSGAERVL